MRRFLFIVGAAWTCSPAYAQSAGVELRLESQTIEVGETIPAQIVCTNTGAPTLPPLPAPPGLKLRIQNATPSVSSMTSFINGRRSSQQTYIYALRLTGEAPGTYTLGPFTVEADDATYQTQPIRVVVRDSATSGLPVADQLTFVRVEVNRTSLYVTESFEATLTIGLRKIYIDDRLLDYDQLLRSVDAGASTLAGFGPQFTPGEITLTDSSGADHEYILYRDRKVIRADQVGPLEIGPVFLKVDYPTAFRRSFWGRGLEPSRTQRVTAKADGVIVDVKGPPIEGRPDEFTGALGRYSIGASATPDRVVQGQPVTLAITIRGAPIDGVAGPNLAQHPELVSRFEFAADELRGDVEQSNTKVFRRAIFPRQQGDQTIPPVRWAYFDPQRQRYVVLATEPISITVDPPAGGDVSAAAWGDVGDGAANPGLTVLGGGILPNVVDPQRVLAQHAVTLLPAHVGALLVAPPAFYLLVTLLVRQRARVRGDRRYARRRRARARARTAIARAGNTQTQAQRIQRLAQTLTAFVSDVFDLGPGVLTPGDVQTVLDANGIDPGLTREIVAFLRTADVIRYAPSAAETAHADQAAGNVSQWIDGIQKSVA